MSLGQLLLKLADETLIEVRYQNSGLASPRGGEPEMSHLAKSLFRCRENNLNTLSVEFK